MFRGGIQNEVNKEREIRRGNEETAMKNNKWGGVVQRLYDMGGRGRGFETGRKKTLERRGRPPERYRRDTNRTRKARLSEGQRVV